MGKSIRPAVLAHLDQDKLERLDELSDLTRIPRAVLIREAIDDLLEKHRPVWNQRGPKPIPARDVHRARLAKAARPK